MVFIFNTSTNDVPSITVSCVFLIAFFSLFVILCSFCCCNMQMCSQCEIIKVESALIPFVGLKSNKRKQEVPVKGEGKNGNGWARLSLQTTECMEWRVGEGEGIKKKGIHRFLGIHKSHIRGGGCFNGMQYRAKKKPNIMPIIKDMVQQSPHEYGLAFSSGG